MNEVEQQAADTVISRMEFLEQIATAAQGHWDIIESQPPPHGVEFVAWHASLGDLLKQNREASE